MRAPSPHSSQNSTDLPDGITIRPLTFIDNLTHVGTLVQAMVGCDADFQLLERSRVAYALARWAFLPVYFHLACVGYGAFEGERLAGMVYLCGWQQALHIDALAVHPDYRQHGVGRALLRLAERRARKLGRRWVSLRVTVGNKAAVSLYESDGFRRTHHLALHIDGQALASTGNGHVSLRPLAGPGAHTTCLTYTRDDLSKGEAWAADVLAAQMATRPISRRRLHWMCRVDGRDMGYLALGGPATSPGLYLATSPDWWGTAEEKALLGAALARLKRTPAQVEVRLASYEHHQATARALASLNPAERPIAKMTMLKPLTALAETQEQGGRNGH